MKNYIRASTSFCYIYGIGGHVDYEPVSPYSHASLVVIATANRVSSEEPDELGGCVISMSVSRTCIYDIECDSLLDACSLEILGAPYREVLESCRTYASSPENWKFLNTNWRLSFWELMARSGKFYE